MRRPAFALKLIATSALNAMRLPAQHRGFLDQAGFGAMTCQQFWLALLG
jgi:hypothetical protein